MVLRRKHGDDKRVSDWPNARPFSALFRASLDGLRATAQGLQGSRCQPIDVACSVSCCCSHLLLLLLLLRTCTMWLMNSV
jgi:hypothetical protein